MTPLHLKSILGTIWVAALAAIFFLWWNSGIKLADTPQLLETTLRQFGLYRAALIYIVIYALRPLIFFPATLLTIASGLLFGPWLGVLFTIIGENASANFAFLLARWFGRGWVENNVAHHLQNWEDRLKQRGLLTVLIMRLIMLPFDVVNYGCGLTAMRQRDFAIGTFIGILPALISFVLLGGVGYAGVQNRLALFLLSLAFLILGIAVAAYLKRREKT